MAKDSAQKPQTKKKKRLQRRPKRKDNDLPTRKLQMN